MDCYNASLRAVSQDLGWDEGMVKSIVATKSGRRQKVGSKWAPEFPTSFIAEIEKANALDISLYEFARELFQNRTGEKCLPL